MNPHARKQYQHRKLYNHRPSYNTYTPAYNTIDIPDPTLPPRSPWGNPVGGVWGEPLGENPGGTLGEPWGNLGGSRVALGCPKVTQGTSGPGGTLWGPRGAPGIPWVTTGVVPCLDALRNCVGVRRFGRLAKQG